MKFVYCFGNSTASGNKSMKDLLGGKGANLHEMTQMGFPVPAGFTISTEACKYFYQNNQQFPPELKEEVEQGISFIEKSTGFKFGDTKSPLLVSVRSGARVSMPGMMDTVLNLGLNEKTVEGLASSSQNPRFAWDSYRRFIQMFSDVVLGVSSHDFERKILLLKEKRKAELDSDLAAEDLKDLAGDFLTHIRKEAGLSFPTDPREQLWKSISAVFQSWSSSRAVSYRRIHKISEEWGTAVNVQAMVFGNLGDDSATGVAFTRDPSTGEKRFFGEYLPNAQGEDVVAGIRTPYPINAYSIMAPGYEDKTMEKLFPDTYKELVKLYQELEKHYKDMQDIEFTVQKGKLYLLQTRSAKRTASAAVRSAVDMVEEKLIDPKEAVLRVAPAQIEQLLHPRLDPKAEKKLLAKGLPASPGAASGEVTFSSHEAENLKKLARPCILVRHETSPEDIGGMDASQGILTALGGLTSHAAVVARGMGKPCVAGCSSINIDYSKRQFKVGDKVIQAGDWITIDGTSGEVLLGTVPTINSQVDQYFTQFMKWVDGYRQLKVRTNAETPNDVKVARSLGAEGVGLCRTEHMFFEESRILAVRQMILAQNSGQRETALQKIFPMQKEDFKAIFRAMKGFPVTVRLLDPPLHEFLPKNPSEMKILAASLNIGVEDVERKVQSVHEFNPMLGHRGCRLAITYPEIYQMQVRAILEAASEISQEEGSAIEPEIMIPFVTDVEELKIIESDLKKVQKQTEEKYGVKLQVHFGTMIEIPRAALLADQIARETQFFSFGTNDLTQMTLALSRDDAGHFLPYYTDKKIYKQDPFVSLDQEGVGELIRIAVERGKKGNPGLKIGICGEHGGDAATIEFCHGLGFNYVSCSPFRVPVARLAAAQAALKK